MINNRMRIEQQRMVDNGEGNDNKQATMQLRKVNTVWKENLTERKTSPHAIRHTVIKVIRGISVSVRETIVPLQALHWKKKKKTI